MVSGYDKARHQVHPAARTAIVAVPPNVLVRILCVRGHWRVSRMARQMNLEALLLADLVASDPRIDIIDDRRVELDYVLVRCPNTDGTTDHALHVCNPRAELPAHAYCLSDACAETTTLGFMRLLGLSIERH